MSREVSKTARQSPPVDTKVPYDDSTIRGKTILITGGASGFGEGFARRWAAAGATIILGDINDSRGIEVAADIRKETGNSEVHYLHCDVTNWQSQVNLFHAAISLSPTKGIDAVVANAGIFDKAPMFIQPKGLDQDTPPEPNLSCADVCLTGVLYTTHLALFYLPRNPRSQAADPKREPAAGVPDRHLLLLGSVASLAPLTFLPLYNASKHAVLGLFRSLRSSSFVDGVRVNLLCPYFIDTPLINSVGRVLLAGTATGKPEDVVDAGTRLMADTRIAGRALVVGPKIKLDENGEVLTQESLAGEGDAVWEVYGHDLDQVDAFVTRFVNILNVLEKAKGWAGWGYDILLAIAYPFRGLFRR